MIYLLKNILDREYNSKDWRRGKCKGSINKTKTGDATVKDQIAEQASITSFEIFPTIEKMPSDEGGASGKAPDC